MLPTEKASQIVQPLVKLQYYEMPLLTDGQGRHLYLTSDREIKEGDWCITAYGKLIQFPKEPEFAIEHYKKIEATTNSSLWYLPTKEQRIDDNIPQIPESFIQAYVKANGDIKEVMIEYIEANNSFNGVYHEESGDFIKTRPNNTVIISQSKLYTRDEVIGILAKYTIALRSVEVLDKVKWAEENL